MALSGVSHVCMDSGSGHSRRAITLYSLEVFPPAFSGVLFNCTAVAGSIMFNWLASSAFTVTFFAPSTCYQQVASGLVALAGSADGALFSSESRAAEWRRKMASH
jgi:hypothetical protein